MNFYILWLLKVFNIQQQEKQIQNPRNSGSRKKGEIRLIVEMVTVNIF